MKRQPHIFTKLICCEICDNNYRYISDRKVGKYICNGYSMKKENTCTKRFAIKEDDLVQMVQIFCNRNQMGLLETNDFMKSIIDKIYVNGEEESIRIKYRNGEEAHMTNKKILI